MKMDNEHKAPLIYIFKYMEEEWMNQLALSSKFNTYHKNKIKS
jgi:hypothetical protein